MGALLLAVVIVLAVTAGVVALAWFPARRLAARMLAIDAELRPGEDASGECGACDGLGTRIEHYAEGPARVTCYRCGGSGEPPPSLGPGEVPTIHPGGAWTAIWRNLPYRPRPRR